MLVPLSNTPRDYAWGSTTLIAELEGRAPSSGPEAEVWFGDHPGAPSRVADGRTLAQWLGDGPPVGGAPARLPYLLKLLAAASPLSIQVHPSRAQAAAGFAREDAEGVARDAPERTYRDDNHKPELIVALSDTFRALAGLRPLARTARLLTEVGPAADGLAARLASSPTDAIAWALSSDATADVREIVAAARRAGGARGEFADELALAAELDDRYPGDPGVVVAMLMNLVTLRRGEGLFIAAGVLHAYLEGLGVELMAASDNVLRGGLTPKHIDVAGLVAVLDPTTRAVPLTLPEPVSPGVSRYAVPVDDFSLLVASPGGRGADAAASVPLNGIAIVLATAGEVAVTGSASGERRTLTPGSAVLVTPDEGALRVEGDGEVFVAAPGS